MHLLQPSPSVAWLFGKHLPAFAAAAALLKVRRQLSQGSFPVRSKESSLTGVFASWTRSAWKLLGEY